MRRGLLFCQKIKEREVAHRITILTFILKREGSVDPALSSFRIWL